MPQNVNRSPLPEGVVVIGKNPDRLVYIQAINRCLLRNGKCEVRLYTSSYDEQGYCVVGKWPSIAKMIFQSEMKISQQVFWSIDDGYIKVILQKVI